MPLEYLEAWTPNLISPQLVRGTGQSTCEFQTGQLRCRVWNLAFVEASHSVLLMATGLAGQAEASAFSPLYKWDAGSRLAVMSDE